MQDVVRLESFAACPVVGAAGAVMLNERFTLVFGFNESRDMDQLAGRVVGTMHPSFFSGVLCAKVGKKMISRGASEKCYCCINPV